MSVYTGWKEWNKIRSQIYVKLVLVHKAVIQKASFVNKISLSFIHKGKFNQKLQTILVAVVILTS